MAEEISYFASSYDSVRYPVGQGDSPGLRKSQRGALHALGAHFTLHDRPAVVVLPTGAGKTAVLMLTPYLLRATRALVITPSKFVRNQIKRDFAKLKTLKRAKALPSNLAPPDVYENKKTIRSLEDWEALRTYDVVVSTPNGASPAYAAIPPPPDDLFDLVLIDEAHHSPARTWNALIEAFPRARCTLFTATPFRRDGKEIRGKYVYTYPIQRAFDDGIYGEMDFVSVESPSTPENDTALARATEEVFLEDEQAGFTHALMVRADSRPRADELAEVYREHTGLRLEVVHSGRSQSTVDKVVNRLREGEIDGVICVDMLGEGFDLPNLKIAALHAPHRSLAVTLQFFGRFARTSGEGLGKARFLAVQEEIEEDLNELYGESEAWGHKIRAIGQARIGDELFTREFLDDFEEAETASDVDASLEDLSLYSFSLFNHVKIFQARGDVDLRVHPEIRGFTTEKVWVNGPRSTLAFLVREEVRPKWASTDGLDRIEHHLFVVYFDEPSKLLFICATYREESAYKDVADVIIDGYAQPLSLSKINRVLRSFSELELFNVGMRNRMTGTVAESYRQIAGSAAHNAIDKGDGALYHRGHVFGRGRTMAGVTTIGLSSLSKIWRLESTKIPGLVKWCESLARDIENPAPFTTGINLDHLDAGRDITELPEETVLAADWQDEIYRKPPKIVPAGYGGTTSLSLLDFDLAIDHSASNKERIVVEVQREGASVRLEAVLHPYPAVRYADAMQPGWIIERGFSKICLAEYLTHNPLRFHLADGSLLETCQLFEAAAEDEPFDAEALIEDMDWAALNVDIEREYGECSPPKRSIHEWLREYLASNDAEIVFYDHRSGECADFMTVTHGPEGEPIISLYHCKGSGGSKPGDRVDDLFEVCGQAIKSTKWRNKKRLRDHVRRRRKSGSDFVKGDWTSFIEHLEQYAAYDFPLRIYVVQPGVSRSVLSSKMASLLTTTSRGLVASGCQRLKVIASA